ncbi:MAG: hypothetical protein P8Y47_09285 [Alphaproteobacteria bacterium]
MSADDDERVKCIECDAMILPRTANDNDGLCAQCVKIPASLRAEQREFERQVTSGEVFTPSDYELSSATIPLFFLQPTTFWKLGPDFSNTGINSCEQAISEAENKSSGDIFLTAGEDIWLTLTFNVKYGVCYYENDPVSDFRYARSLSNASEQVSGEFHLAQGCPCCGVCLQWFPSRYHLSRDDAFAVMKSVIDHHPLLSVDWLVSGDITRTFRGYG